MAAEGYKKKDMQRGVQKVHTGTSVSSIQMDASNLTDRVEIGFPGSTVTLVTTGNLAASVQPIVGPANANASIAATTTPSTTTTSHMFTALVITRTSGVGKVLILVK